jgi:tetratricopeptide (TPR) repeat protein
MKALKKVIDKEQYAKSHRDIYNQALYSLAALEVECGKLDDALIHFNECIALDPERIDAYFTLGMIANKIGLKEKAKYHFQKALDINPGPKIAGPSVSVIKEMAKKELELLS